jgi:AcrR family transcriptional regulator
MSLTGRRSITGVRKRSSPDSGIRRVRLENDQRKSQLLELGRSEFARRSYDEVSIDDIANAAGISSGLLYHYFPTKRDLYLAGLRATAGHLVAHIINQTTGSESSLDKALIAYLEHAVANREAYVALMGGGIGSDPEVTDVVATTRSAFWRILTQDGDTEGNLSVHAWMGAVEGATLAWLRDPDIAQASSVADMLLTMRAATVAARAA